VQDYEGTAGIDKQVPGAIEVGRHQNADLVQAHVVNSYWVLSFVSRFLSRAVAEGQERCDKQVAGQEVVSI
jgi:hypothetical protein